MARQLLAVPFLLVVACSGVSAPAQRAAQPTATSQHSGSAGSRAALAVCGLLTVQDVEAATGLRVRTHSATPVADNSANCRWLLEPAPNAVFLNVASPNAGVALSDLFKASVQGMPGHPVPELGPSSWQGTGQDDAVVVVKGAFVLKVTVEGPGSASRRYGQADDERMAQLLVTHLVAQM
ncbi:MAG: hypothetical protein JO086_07715 [Acidimicrobiia bacterium]|nr:hypothetical protein [Acidimicrobiia bacterium]